MNKELFLYSIAEICISIVLGVMLMYLAYRLIDKFVRKKNDIKIDNLAYSIFSSSIIFSVAYLVSGIKSPILNALRMLENNPAYEGSLVIDGLKYSVLFLIILIITISIIIFLSIKLFTFMTKEINEFKEIGKNNVAVAIITATIIISMSILVKDSLYLMLETFVPYPEDPRIF